MRKNLKLLVVAPLTISILVLSTFAGFMVSAGSATSTGEIDVTVTNNSSARIAPAVTTLTATIADSGFNDISSQTGVSIAETTTTSGVYKITGFAKTGDYYITLTSADDKSTERIKTTVSSLTAVDQVAAKWDDATSVALGTSNSGVLGGLATTATGAAEASLYVEAYNAAGTLWTTTTDDRGAYTLVVCADSASNKNISSSVTVVKGCATGPMLDQTQTAWGTTSTTNNTLGYVAPTSVAYGATTIAGSANPGCTVAAYAYGGTTDEPTYTLLGKAVTVNSTGRFLLTTSAISCGTIEIRVTDTALNVKNDIITVSGRKFTLTASTATATAGIATALKLVDSTTGTAATDAAFNAYLASEVTGVTATSGNTTLTLTKNTDFTVSSGTLVINAGVLYPATWTIAVTATGYTSGGTASQIIATSATVATGLTGATFKAAAGTVADSTAITATKATAATGCELVYKVVDASTTKSELMGNVYSAFSTATVFTSAANITGVASTNVVDIYEINTTTGIILTVNRVALAATTVKAPSFTAAAVDATGKTVTLTADEALTGKTTLAATAFIVMDGTTQATVSTVTVSGTTVTLTLGAAISNTDKVTVAYNTSANLIDACGNAVATLASTTLTVSNSSTFVKSTDSTTANTVAVLGTVGTSVKSSDTTVATADLTTKSGYVTIKSVGAGTATISVINGTKTATIAVTVSSTGGITIGTITTTLTSTTDRTTANTVAILGIIGTRVSSSDSTIATASISSGYIAITSVKAGTATITVTDASSHTATIGVTVSATGVITIGTITKYAPTFTSATDSTTANTSNVLGLVGTSVTSSDSTIATADLTTKSGYVTITSVNAGTATISVTDGTGTATIGVTVAASGAITIGTITKYTATTTPSVSGATSVAGTSIITYTLSSGAFDSTAATSVNNWTLGGNDQSDIGFMESIVLSNSNMTATITIAGSSVYGDNYTILPGQAAFATGTAPTTALTVTVTKAGADAPTLAGVSAATGSSKIVYSLSTGTFATDATTTSNWTLGGADVSDLGQIMSINLSDNNKTAQIIVTGNFWSNNVYTILPAQAVFASGTTAPTTAIRVTVTSTPTIPALTGVSLADASGFDYDGEGVITLPTAATGYSYRFYVPSYSYPSPTLGDGVPNWGVATNGAILDLSTAASIDGSNPSQAQDAAAVNGLNLYVAEVDANNKIVKFVSIPITCIVDYVSATDGSLTGTVSFPTDSHLVSDSDSSVVNAVDGQSRSFTISVDGGAAVTINISAGIGSVIDLINAIQAPIQHVAVVTIGANNCIQIVSGSTTGGTSSKIVLSGNYQAFFGTSPKIVNGTNSVG